NPIVLCVVVDCHEMPAQGDRLVLRLRPGGGCQEIVNVPGGVGNGPGQNRRPGTGDGREAQNNECHEMLNLHRLTCCQALGSGAAETSCARSKPASGGSPRPE